MSDLLTYVHPLAMALGLLLAVATLRSGLRVRRFRALRRKGRAAAHRAHLRLAKPTVIWLCTGFTLGPLAQFFLHDKLPFTTAHSWLGSLAILLFATTALLGRQLEFGNPRVPRQLHIACALSALLAGAIAAVFGYGLLP